MYDKSLSIIQDAMKDIKQEIVIHLNGQYHIVYITDLTVGSDGGIHIHYNTVDQSMKDELYPHIEKCVRLQIQEIMNEARDDFVIQDYFY